MADERPTPGRRAQDLDREVEALSKRIAEVVNQAGPDARDDLREYAIELLKEETERVDAPAPGAARETPPFNPLAIALLLVLASLPLFLSVVFAPVGLAVLGLAAVMGLWGVVATWWKRD